MLSRKNVDEQSAKAAGFCWMLNSISAALEQFDLQSYSYPILGPNGELQQGVWPVVMQAGPWVT